MASLPRISAYAPVTLVVVNHHQALVLRIEQGIGILDRIRPQVAVAPQVTVTPQITFGPQVRRLACAWSFPFPALLASAANAVAAKTTRTRLVIAL